jgi:pimeloyl-ACP methyl ester carboxylesterase
MEDKEKSHSFVNPEFPCFGEANYLSLRGMNFHYLSWGKPENPLIVMLHGFLDHCHTFDLLASKLMDTFYLVAWDARGFGKSDWVHPSGYYHFFEYIYDLELFLEHFADKRPVLLGHSMGGMIAALYAGIFPERVSGLVNLEGWFVADAKFSDAPARARKWIEDVRSLQPFKPLNDIEEAALRLQKNDPLLSSDIAMHLAYEGTRFENDGLHWRHDPLHKTRSPQQTYLGQLEAFWQNIACPVLLLKGEQSSPHLADFKSRVNLFKNCQFVEIEDSGHNLHLHQPGIISQIIRDFLITRLK